MSTDWFSDSELRVLDGKPDGEVLDVEETALAPIVAATTVDDLSPLIRAAGIAGQRNHKAIKRQAEELGRAMERAAFYSFPAGGATIEGATIKLAYALVTLWGRMRVQCTVVAVNGPQIVLRGSALDLVTVTLIERDYVFNLSPPPGKFAKKPDQVERWNTMQIQSAMSKAVRGAILACIPEHIVGAAVEAARRVSMGAVLSALKVQTVEDGVTSIISGFEVKHKVPLVELEAIVGKPKALWAMHELDTLYGRYWLDIKNGVITVAGMRAEAAKLISRPVAAEATAPWVDEAKPATAAEAPPAEPAKPKADPKPAAKPTAPAASEDLEGM